MQKISLSEEDWKKRLTPEQFRVLRKKGTELPFTGEFVDLDDAGAYSCAGCGSPLFSSDAKYHSYSGWPSFYDVVEGGNVDLLDDYELGVHRLEVQCAACGGHLGHLFPDGPPDKGGARYCINSCALTFTPART